MIWKVAEVVLPRAFHATVWALSLGYRAASHVPGFTPAEALLADTVLGRPDDFEYTPRTTAAPPPA